MKVLRGDQPNERFTKIANSLWDDDRLSIEAKSLLGYLISRPHRWETNRTRLAKVLRVGEHTIKSRLQELRQAGYIEDVRLSFREYGIMVTSIPRVDDGRPDSERPDDERPDGGRLDDGRPALIRRTDTKTVRRKIVKKNKGPKKNEAWGEFFSVLENLETATPKRLRGIRPELDQETSVEVFEAWKQQR